MTAAVPPLGSELLARLDAATREPLEANVRRWLAFLGPGTNELQILGDTVSRFAPSLFAHPRTPDEAVALLEVADKRHPMGVFAILNSPDDAVTSRMPAGRWHPTPKGAATTDADIRFRRALFIDVDADRVKGTSATAAELGGALRAAEAVYDALAAIVGESALALGHSGNGAGVYVALAQLEETDELAATCRGIVAAVNARFTAAHPGVIFDTTITDAKRLAPAFGTTKRKGAPDIDARPHRRTGVVTPPQIERLSFAALENLLRALSEGVSPEGHAAIDKAMGRRRAAAAPPAAAPHTAPVQTSAPADDPFARAKEVPIADVLAWLGLLEGGQPVCPGCGLTDGGVAIVKNGLKCSHDRCSKKGMPGRAGWRTPIDVVAEARKLKPLEAVRALGEQFGFEVAKRRKAPRKPRDGRERPDWYEELAVSPRGDLVKSAANIITVLGRDEAWADVIVWDEFAQTVRTTKPPPWDALDCHSPAAGDWEDVDDVRLSSWLSRHHDLHIGADTVHAAVNVVARQRVVNPVVDYLRSLAWDGQARIDAWLSTYLGVEPSDYARLVGRYFLISAVARAFRPGCKVDTMPILEGDQGARKSTAIGVLFGRQWVSDTPPDLASKDRFTALRDRWCVEWGELDGMGKADVDRLKGFLSSAIDDYRPSYGRRTVRVPRRSIFFGSVNKEEYLRDETGNRRFWPVRTGVVRTLDIEGLGRDRDQIWAEAVAALESGARWWVIPEEYPIFASQQSHRVVGDPWLDKIAEWVKPRERVTVAEVLGTMLGIEPSRWTQVDQNRVARCLTLLGWKRVQYRAQGGLRERGYQAPEGAHAPGVTGVTGSPTNTRDDFS